jgi:hypothetical protein
MGQRSNAGGEVEARTGCIELGLFGKERCCGFWKDAVCRDVNGASFFRSFPALLCRTTVTKSIHKSLGTRTRQAMANWNFGNSGWVGCTRGGIFSKKGSTNTEKHGPALARDRGHRVSVSFDKVIDPIRVQAL